MPKSELTEITVQIMHETDKAVLVSDTGESKDAVWLPKSQIDLAHVRDTGEVEVTLPIWLAKDKGLI